MEKTIELYPMYGLWKQPWWQTSWFFYMILGVSGALALGLLWLAIRWYRRGKHKKTSWDLALTRLVDLQQMIARKPDIASKEVYIRITIIIKNYLYSRYAFNVESKTDDELMEFLEQTSLDHHLVTILREIIENSTQAKFAQQQLDVSVTTRDLHDCIHFIRKTIPLNH